MINKNIGAVPKRWHPDELLAELTALAAGCETVVEIGAWLGHSTVALARGCAGRVYSVDHWRGSGGATGEVEDPLDLYARFWANIVAAGAHEKVTPLFERSDRAFVLFADRPIDLLYVDGDHEYKAVLSDLILWGELVRPGGVICGDDYGEAGPKRAVKDYWITPFSREVETRCQGRLFVLRV